MATRDLIDLYTQNDALGLAVLIRSKQVSAREIIDTAIALIEQLDPALNAVIHKAYDRAREAADGPLPDGPFTGVPFLIKELGTMWKGMPVTNSCPYLRDFVAQVDSDIVQRDRDAGLVLLGKSNAPENGWALTTEPALYGPTHNPWRTDVTSGGSSGGSAAAVAARMVPLAEASDGAGSIRVPASNCGIVGLKPSRGRITYAPTAGDYWYGCVYSLCVSRTVRDTAAYLDAIAGTLPGEPYYAPRPDHPWLSSVVSEPRHKLHVGFTITPPDGKAIHPEVAAAVRATAAALEALGHTVEEHDMPFDANSTWTTYTRMTAVQTAMVFDALAGFVGHPVTPEGVSPTTWAIIERGHSINGVQHAADVDSLRMTGRAIAMDLAPYDVYLTPTLTHPPRPLGYWDMNEPDLDRYNATWTDGVFMAPFNISGQPAMSLPMHWTTDGLPVGVQLVGRFGDEATLFEAAAQLEAARPWADRKPPVCA